MEPTGGGGGGDDEAVGQDAAPDGPAADCGMGDGACLEREEDAAAGVCVGVGEGTAARPPVTEKNECFVAINRSSNGSLLAPLADAAASAAAAGSGNADVDSDFV